jgi:hypothetical protein
MRIDEVSSPPSQTLYLRSVQQERIRNVNTIETYLEAVIDDIQSSAEQFRELSRSNIITHPIPFFGNIESATSVTVGVNPSAKEFINRGWPPSLSSKELSERLRGYFVSKTTSPHPWFETWTTALTHVGCSYANQTAHVDLSPRATIAMGSIHDWQGFANMVERDARWFFELLSICKRLKAVFLAGCVTKKWYMSEFVARIAPRYGYRVTGMTEKSGAGRIGFLRLHGPRGEIPMFFCSVSPSGQKRHLLIERVCSHQNTIKQWL